MSFMGYPSKEEITNWWSDPDITFEHIPVIYIAGPYRADCEYDVSQNIRTAEDFAAMVWRMGAVALCPHKNTSHFGGAYGLPDATWLKGDWILLKRCDAVLLVGDWENSEGSLAEIEFAEKYGIPVLNHIDLVPGFIQAWCGS